jgi:hypothetical protein
MRPHVQIINASTVVSDDDLRDYTEALQIQVTEHFSPAWNCNAVLTFVPKGQTPDPKQWWLTVLDDVPQGDFLGYHDVTPTGLPVGKVFAKLDLQYGDSVSVTLSHELVELLADPSCTDCMSTWQGNLIYAKETADACEADNLGYEITIKSGRKILVSDFVLPAYFCDEQTEGTTPKYDFCGHITKPFQILPGGYMSYLDTSKGEGWKEFTADDHNVASRKPVGSRYERRRRLHQTGQAPKLSTVKL